jgi:hypothetical protein
MGISNGLWHFCKNNTETLQHLFFQCFKIKPIIEELNTMIIALCDQNYVLNEENIMLGVYLYDKHNIKEVLFEVICKQENRYNKKKTNHQQYLNNIKEVLFVKKKYFCS